MANNLEKAVEDALLRLRELHGIPDYNAPLLLLRRTRRHAGVAGDGADGGEEGTWALMRGAASGSRTKRRQVAAEMGEDEEEAAAREEARRHVAAVSLPFCCHRRPVPGRKLIRRTNIGWTRG